MGNIHTLKFIDVVVIYQKRDKNEFVGDTINCEQARRVFENIWSQMNAIKIFCFFCNFAYKKKIRLFCFDSIQRFEVLIVSRADKVKSTGTNIWLVICSPSL